MKFDFVAPVLYTEHDIRFYDRLAAELERLGCRVALIACTRQGHAALSANHPHVFYLYEGFDRRRQADPAEMRDIERRLGLVSITDLVYAESCYPWGCPIETMYGRAVHDVRFLEGFLERHEVALFLNNIGGEVIRRTMARLADAGGPRNLIVDFAPIRGRLALTTSETSWDDLPARPPALSPSERKLAEDLVAHATGERKMFYGPSTLGLQPRNFLNFFRDAAKSLLDGEGSDVSIPALARERAQRVVRRAFNTPLYQQPIPGDEYVFFPLHLGSDSAITIRAPHYEDQEALVEYLARRTLPTGTTLYVKPHVGARDAYAVPMMVRLRRMPGVRLIDPRVNSHDLIAGARAMVVINSTVGFESLFHLKPVVVLGRVFYRGFGVTTDVDNPGDVGRLLRRAMEQPPDREAVLRFLHACHRATSPGRFGDPSSENIERVAGAILAKAARLREAQAATSLGPDPS